MVLLTTDFSCYSKIRSAIDGVLNAKALCNAADFRCLHLTFHWTMFSFFREDKDREKMRVWFEQTEKALATMQEASQELLSRGLIVDPQIFQSAVQHQTLHALGEQY